MKTIKNITFSILLVASISFFFYRLNGYTYMKEIYPNDELNISFFMLKILG